MMFLKQPLTVFCLLSTINQQPLVRSWAIWTLLLCFLNYRRNNNYSILTPSKQRLYSGQTSWSNIVAYPPASNSENSESQLQQHFASLAYPNELPSQLGRRNVVAVGIQNFQNLKQEGRPRCLTTMFDRNTNVACQG